MPLPPKVIVSAIRPPGFSHSGAFDEVYEVLTMGLRQLGLEVACVENAIASEYPTIVFGGHLLASETLESLPPSVIFYNLEQADPGAAWLQGPFPKAMQSHEVWDFNEINVRRLSQAGIAPRLVWCPVGFADELWRIPQVEEDIDVLFYGSLNPRRIDTLNALKAAGLNVVHSFGAYGKERDALIARAKVVLNVHFYESGIFEWVRVFYLLANRKAVVSEDSILTAFDKGIDQVVRFASYHHLVDACQAMVADAKARQILVEGIPPYIAARREDVILQSVLSSSHVFNPRQQPAP